jgi:hypothetical protein
MEAPFPDDESEDAKEGTAAHWVAAQVLGGHCAIEELTDRKAPNGVIVTGEMVEHTQMYIDTVRQVTPAPVIEQMLSVLPSIEPGTPDARYVSPDGHGFVWDFKYGYGIVEVLGNWQVACYAIGLFIKHEWQLHDVTVTIVQPRPFHPDGRARSWTIDRDSAWTLSQRLQDAAAETQNPAAQVASGPHCQYCRALAVCEAARRAALNGVDVAYKAMPQALSPVDTAGELRTLRRAADAIKLRLDATEAYATSLIDGGQVVPGWSLERAMGRRRWANPDDVAALEALTGLTLRTLAPVTPAAAEKLGADKTIVKMFTTTPETGRKLVERDASAKAAEVFGTPA